MDKSVFESDHINTFFNLALNVTFLKHFFSQTYNLKHVVYKKRNILLFILIKLSR